MALGTSLAPDERGPHCMSPSTRTPSPRSRPDLFAQSAPRSQSSPALTLVALRSAVDSLSRDLSQARAAHPELARALRDAQRLGHGLDDLIELESAPRPRALACTLSDVLYQARLAFAKRERARLLLAREACERRVSLDGPLLAKALARLIANALESSSEPVLVHARCQGHWATLAILDQSAAPGLSLRAPPEPFRSTKPGRMGLGLHLAWRSIAALGGALSVQPRSAGGTRVWLSIPLQSASAQGVA